MKAYQFQLGFLYQEIGVEKGKHRNARSLKQIRNRFMLNYSNSNSSMIQATFSFKAMRKCTVMLNYSLLQMYSMVRLRLCFHEHAILPYTGGNYTDRPHQQSDGAMCPQSSRGFTPMGCRVCGGREALSERAKF